MVCLLKSHGEGVVTNFLPWQPNRVPSVAVGGWRALIRRLDLRRTEDPQWAIYDVVHGQDGWAFALAIHWQVPAEYLASTCPQFFWSAYYLLAQLIEKTRHDLPTLEAAEVIYLAQLPDDQVCVQLQRLGIWPHLSK